jgi:hypothetical protein
MAMTGKFERGCEEEGYRQPISKKNLFAALRNMGVNDSGNSDDERFWSGIRQKNEREWIAADQIHSGTEHTDWVITLDTLDTIWFFRKVLRKNCTRK